MHVRCYHSLAELEPYRGAWDRLAGDCTFRSWTWLSTWWRFYGGNNDAANFAERRRRRLFVLLAFAEDDADAESPASLVGVLPCYAMRSISRGRSLCLLGDGEVCSDHLGLLAEPSQAPRVAAAMADHLAQDARWDLMDFNAIDAGDEATVRLFAALAVHGCQTAAYPGDACWAIDLPGDWEQFLALQSKSHRKQLRQAERRVLDAGLATWRRVETGAEFDSTWLVLTDLHQRRRQSLGEPGCFALPSWAAFHRAVARQLLDEGRLRLSWLEMDGAPVAAEYHLAGAQTTYAYQGGVDPARLADEPGRLSTIRAIQQAIAEGHSRFDFLRGDEPYKAHWRAQARPTWRRQAIAPRALPKLRQQTWASARRVGRLARQLTALFS